MNDLLIKLFKSPYFNKTFKINLANSMLFILYATIFVLSLMFHISFILKVIAWLLFFLVLTSMHIVRKDLYKSYGCTKSFGTTFEKVSHKVNCFSLMILGFYLYKTVHGRYIIVPTWDFTDTGVFKVVNLVPNQPKLVGFAF